MSNHIIPSNESPFDQIRQVDTQGNEFWSARDLMEAMDYAEWRKFEGAIRRAWSSAENRGTDHIVPSDKMVQLGSGAQRRVIDYRLTRFGAYLVVMNGDPRKPEIADAQAYFAVKTREAEVMNPASLDLSDPGSIVQLAEQWLNTAKAYETERERRLELEGPAAQQKFFRDGESKQLIGDVANRFKAYAADRYPLVKVYHQDVWDHAGRLGIIIRGGTVRNNQPTAQAIEAGWATSSETVYERKSGGMGRSVSPRLTTKGEARLWDGLVRYVEEHGTLSIPKAGEAA